MDNEKREFIKKYVIIVLIVSLFFIIVGYFLINTQEYMNCLGFNEFLTETSVGMPYRPF